MSPTRVNCGFLPLVDCAPLVLARELGFASDEGLDLRLVKAKSWAAVRDKLALGVLDAAQMLSPTPIAMSLGLGGMPTRIDALSVLSVNGDVIGVSPALADAMRAQGPNGGAPTLGEEAAEVGRRLIAAAPKPLTIGVPFPFSMHAELLTYWLGALGLRQPEDLRVRTIPPPAMPKAVAAGEIDAFCVGEPWGSLAAAAGVAELALPGAAIWGFAPEKVLAVSHAWIHGNAETVGPLLRAVWRAGRWLGDPNNAMTAAEFLSRAAYVGVSAEVIERTLRGRMLVSPSLGERATPRLVEFFDGAATFPWRSQAIWIAVRLAERNGIDPETAAQVARDCFRTDLYRATLGPIGADLPAASEKLEGALLARTAVASSVGEMYLGPDRFFDGKIFDPKDWGR
ncbi:MAG: CmpA/NrtA family ABC transporter substrate-binding protein [Pseudomonadota bacterium]